MRHSVRALIVLAAFAAVAALPAAAAADAGSYRSLVMGDDPTGYWRLDEPTGPLGRNEVAGGQRLRYFQHPLLEEDGAFAGSSGVTAGFRSLIDVGPPVGPDTDATYELWFKMQPGFDGENYEGLIEVPFDWGAWVFNGRIQGGCHNDSWPVGPHVADGSWHHLALRFVGDRIQLFVDGEQFGDTFCDYDRGWDRVRLGWGGGRTFVQPMPRTFDEVAMYDRALPDATIAAHAAARTAADDGPGRLRAALTGGDYTDAVLADDPFSYYRLEDRPWNADGSRSLHVEDSSGNGRHAVMHLGGMDRAPGPIASEARNLSMRPRTHRFTVPAPSAADVSVETWVKFNDPVPENVSGWFGGGRLALYFRGEELSVLPYGLVTLGDGYWNDRAWHHVVVTKDTANDRLRVYRDGVLLRDDMVDRNDAPPFEDGLIGIGGGDALNPGYCLDEVAVYEGVLSPARVAAHYGAAGAERANGGCGGTSDVPAARRPAKPASTSPPRARGVARPGNLVWCDPGEWSGAPIGFRQQWYRDGRPILGAVEWAHMVSAADDGKELTCRVVATGAGGDSDEVASEPVTASGRPVAPGAPRVTGGDVRHAVSLTWDATPADPVAADGYIVQFRRGSDPTWHVFARPAEPAARLEGPGEGTYRFRAIAQSGGTESDPSPESDPVVVDRTGPVARLVVQDEPAHGEWYRDSVTASWEYDEDPPLPDGTPGTGIDPATEPPASVTRTTTGAHVVEALLRDRAGNGAITSRVLRVDADAPTLTLSCPPLAHVGAIAHASVHASDGNGSGLDAAVPAQLTVDTATSGVRTLSLTARDNVGHATSASCTVPVVHRRPSAPRLVAGTSPGNGAVTIGWSRHALAPPPAAYVLEARDADDTGWTQVQRGAEESWATTLAQGTWTFRVRVDDPAFDADWSEVSAPVVVDRTAPAAPSAATDRPADATGDWFRDTVTVSFAGAGDPALPDGSPGSGADPATVTAPVTFSTAGSHTATGTLRDRAGNASPSTSRTVRVDTTAPTAAIACPAADVLQDASATAAWTAADTGSGLAGAASGTVALATGSVGTFTVAAPVIRDRVGHVAPAASCTYRVIYDFAGFNAPLVNPPDVNQVDGGDVAPVIFRLNGDRGLGVLAGEPTTAPSGCGGKKENVDWTLPRRGAACGTCRGPTCGRSGRRRRGATRAAS